MAMVDLEADGLAIDVFSMPFHIRNRGVGMGYFLVSQDEMGEYGLPDQSRYEAIRG